MSRPYQGPKPLISAVSMASSITSTPINLEQLSLVGFDVAWTGAPVGTFSIQVSNSYSIDAVGNQKSIGNWTDLTLSNVVAPAGTASNGFIDIDSISATWIRLVYNRTSGTGSLTCYASAKVS